MFLAFVCQGLEETSVVLYVLVDNEPKINQEYRVSLLNVVSEGIYSSRHYINMTRRCTNSEIGKLSVPRQENS